MRLCIFGRVLLRNEVLSVLFVGLRQAQADKPTISPPCQTEPAEVSTLHYETSAADILIGHRAKEIQLHGGSQRRHKGPQRLRDL